MPVKKFLKGTKVKYSNMPCVIKEVRPDCYVLQPEQGRPILCGLNSPYLQANYRSKYEQAGSGIIKDHR